MFRACMTFTLMVFLLFTGSVQEASAKIKKKKAKASISNVSKSKKKTKRNSRYAKAKQYRRSGTGPDLRALTTEKPNTEYIKTPDNGVNAVETKSEL